MVHGLPQYRPLAQVQPEICIAVRARERVRSGALAALELQSSSGQMSSVVDAENL